MDTQEKKGKELNAEEEKEFRDGSALYEMVQTSGGWQVVNKILEGAAYHTWVNPLDCASERICLEGIGSIFGSKKCTGTT